MNKKQYNNVIDWTLTHDQSAQTEDSLETARTVFKNMGVALPQGDLKQVSDVLKTDDYMGWRSCTMQEAQAAADRGTAAIGISEEKIVILAANDEEQPVTATASVMTLSNTAAVSPEPALAFYSYSKGGTTPGGTSGGPFTEYVLVFNPQQAFLYTHCLQTKVFDERKFSLFEEWNEWNLEKLVTEILEKFAEIVEVGADYIPVIGDIVSIGSDLAEMNKERFLLELEEIAYCIERCVLDFTTCIKIYVLLGSPQRQVKIEDLNGTTYFVFNITQETLSVLYHYGELLNQIIQINKVPHGYQY